MTMTLTGTEVNISSTKFQYNQYKYEAPNELAWLPDSRGVTEGICGIYRVLAVQYSSAWHTAP